MIQELFNEVISQFSSVNLVYLLPCYVASRAVYHGTCAYYRMMLEIQNNEISGVMINAVISAVDITFPQSLQKREVMRRNFEAYENKGGAYA